VNFRSTRSLAATQRWLFRAVTSAGDPNHLESSESEALRAIVRAPPTESAEERLLIYRRAYFSRLEECLSDDYPALRFAIGSKDFSRLCRAYVSSYPSSSANLNGFGSQMAQFILESEPSWVFERELAALEWKLVEVIHAPAPASRLASDLSEKVTSNLAELRFVASPSVRILATDYPVNAYFQAFINDAQPSRPSSAPSWLVLVRNGYKIWRLDLQSDEALVLQCLLSGDMLGNALRGVQVGARTVQQWFRRWSSCGIFTSARSANEECPDDAPRRDDPTLRSKMSADPMAASCR